MTTTPDHYMPDRAYVRLLEEVATLHASLAHPRHGDPLAWAVEFLGLAGVWPEGIFAEDNALKVPAES